MKAKKLMALLFSLFTVFVLFAFSASAEDVGPCGHSEENWKWYKISQTCTSEGEYRCICNFVIDDQGSICGEIIEVEKIPAHNFTVIFTPTEATCVNEGLEVVYCSWCNTIENRVVPVDPGNHKWSEWKVIKDSDCSNAGVKERKCTREGCGKIDTASIPTDSSKHIANGQVPVITAPTCEAEGAEKKVCAVCGKDFSTPIPIHSDYIGNTGDDEKYKYKENSIVESTCTKRGYTEYKCKDCHKTFKVYHKESGEHDFSDESLWEYTPGATCKDKGKLIKYCKISRNHRVEEEYAPHDYSGIETVIVAPKCEKINGETVLTDGVKTVRCLYCDAVEEKPVAGTHSFGYWNITGTCAKGGTASRTCDCTDVTETITFPALTHLNLDYSKCKKVEPSCVRDGHLYIYCTECDKYVYVFPEELKARGSHKLGKEVVTDKATCEKSGMMDRYCAICDEVIETVVVPQLDHDCVILEAGYEPTCKEPGLSNYLYCIMCAGTFNPETIPARGHNFVEQNTPAEGAVRICDVCYEYEIVTDKGDPVTCKCLCHNSNGLAKTIYKIITFFSKILGINQECKCGIPHYEAGSGIFGGSTEK